MLKGFSYSTCSGPGIKILKCDHSNKSFPWYSSSTFRGSRFFCFIFFVFFVFFSTSYVAQGSSHFEYVDEILAVAIQTKATEMSFPVIVLTFDSMDEILKQYSFDVFCRMEFRIF